MLITRTRHEAAIAYKDAIISDKNAIIADLKKNVLREKQFLEERKVQENKLRQQLSDNMCALEARLASQQKTMERTFAANLRLATDNQKLRHPPRDALGRFVKWENGK